MASFNQNMAISGLGTFALIPAPAAGPYVVDVKFSIPTLTNGGGASSLLTLIKNNGSTIYTSDAGDDSAKVDLICAAGDAITIVTSSSAAADIVLNAIKGAVAFSQGV